MIEVMIKGSHHTESAKRKVSEFKKKHPVRYWLGKKNPHTKDTIRKIVASNTKNGRLDYFKTHTFKGADHAKWKGDEVGYDALHSWLYRELGRPETCVHCGKTKLKGRKIHWANKSGEYKRVFTDWLRLCAKCHYHYDRK